MDVDTYAWLRGSKYRLTFLRALSATPMLPSELATKFKINRSSVSRTLSELEKYGLINKSSRFSRTIIYTVTEKGKCLLKYTEQIETDRRGGTGAN